MFFEENLSVRSAALWDKRSRKNAPREHGSSHRKISTFRKHRFRKKLPLIKRGTARIPSTSGSFNASTLSSGRSRLELVPRFYPTFFGDGTKKFIFNKLSFDTLTYLFNSNQSDKNVTCMMCAKGQLKELSLMTKCVCHRKSHDKISIIQIFSCTELEIYKHQAT